jgi:hypothetical protein
MLAKSSPLATARRRAAVAELLRDPALLRADPAVQQLMREMFEDAPEERPVPKRPRPSRVGRPQPQD